MVKLDDLAITCKWSRRRRTIGLVVTAAGNLEVAAPWGTPQAKIAQVVAQHRPWIERKAAARREAWARLKPGTAFYLGQPYRLHVVRGSRAAVELGADQITIQLPAAGSAPWPTLTDWYHQQAERLLGERVKYFSLRLGLNGGQVQVKDWKSRWGECRPRQGGLLRFNWRLVMLPPEILDYVVAHELTHLKEAGHNRRFWRQVATVLPDYAHRRRWLNLYGTPFLTWQPSNY